jgi:hypothetical protein
MAPPLALTLPSRAARPTRPLVNLTPTKALRSAQKNSFVWGGVFSKESAGDPDYDPKEKSVVDVGDYPEGITDKERAERRAALERALALLDEIPAKGTKRKTPSPKKAAPKAQKDVPPKTPTRRATRSKAAPPLEPEDDAIEDDEEGSVYEEDWVSGSEYVDESPSKRPKRR